MSQDLADRRKVFDEGMTMLAAAYGKKFAQDQLDVYWRALGSLDSQRMFAAFEEAVKKERYLPTPATVRGYAREPRIEWDRGQAVTLPTPEQLREINHNVERLKKAIRDHVTLPWETKEGKGGMT